MNMEKIIQKIYDKISVEVPIIVVTGKNHSGKTTIFKKLRQTLNNNENDKSVSVSSVISPSILEEEFDTGFVKNVKKKLLEKLTDDNLTVSDWKDFWLSVIVGDIDEMLMSTKDMLDYCTKRFVEQNHTAIVLFDGLDEIFTNLENDKNQRDCLCALLQDIPIYFDGLSEKVLGVIIFVDSYLVEKSITQNEGQFLSKWSAYSLNK